MSEVVQSTIILVFSLFGSHSVCMLCVLMHGVAFDYAPTYLRDVVVPLWTMPGRAHLRSADSGQYDVPRVSTLAGPRAFSVASPLAWNQLPASLRNMNCIATFKRHLKTILFKAAYGVADNCNCVLTIAQHRFILINFLLFSAAVQFCKGRYTNTSL